MALISCEEYGAKVSDKSQHCVHCGAPIALEGIAAGAELTTTQETSKRLKIHILLSSLTLIVGFVLLIANKESPNPEPNPIPSLMVIVGLFWFIVTRFRIWWHHK